MTPKCIGIVGGAGPLAGAYLLDRILKISMQSYGCYRDADFPEVILISFPFADMLSPNRDNEKIQHQLHTCLAKLRTSGASVLGIACNTLHVFLDPKDDLIDFVHLPRLLSNTVALSDNPPLVFCTSTSAQSELHRRFFPCIYPSLKLQKEVDDLIDQTLKGTETSIIVKKLTQLIQLQPEHTIILGCTELSLFYTQLSIPNKHLIDPLEIMAQKLLEKSFSQ